MHLLEPLQLVSDTSQANTACSVLQVGLKHWIATNSMICHSWSAVPVEARVDNV